MAELLPQERLLPSLLDRLTDEEPEKKQESRDRRVLTLRKYREGVIRDLSWLLNTGCMATTENLDDYPLVAESVLNYGMPELTGANASGIDASALEQRVRQAIVSFEPRILRNTIRVRAVVATQEMNHNQLAFEIEAELWAQPAPERLFLRTQVDLETGDIVLGRRE